MNATSHKICIAPMLGYTNRHFRYFMRLISKHVRLYTEMVPANALLKQNLSRFLSFDPIESPLALQLSGNDPKSLKKGAKMGEAYGFDEINLNVGCPSPRVQQGNFGACLMLKPDLVTDCVKAMTDAVDIPISVKTRIGVNDDYSYDNLCQFIGMVSESGCKIFIIHARKGFLDHSFSPKDNRTLPKLEYDKVYRLKQDFPELTIVINGGIHDTTEITKQLNTAIDGVMIGQAAYKNPYFLSEVDSIFFDDEHQIKTRAEIFQQYLNYMETKKDVPQTVLIKPILNLFHGIKNGKTIRRILTEGKIKEVLEAF